MIITKVYNKTIYEYDEIQEEDLEKYLKQIKQKSDTNPSFELSEILVNNTVLVMAK